MNKRKRIKKEKESKQIISNKNIHTIDIRKLFLRDAPKRTGYRPIPGVSIYPHNLREPTILETINDLKGECCNSSHKDVCRCGDIVACPASQEFKSSKNSDTNIMYNEETSISCNQDPIDFRGLRGMLWSKIDPEKLELFERRFSEPNSTGSSPVVLSEKFGAPMFYSKSQPLPFNQYSQESESDNGQTITQQDEMILMEMCKNCISHADVLEQDLRLNIDLQSSIEKELERGVKLLKPRLKQLAISERSYMHIIVNSLSSKVGFPKFDMFYGSNSDEVEYISSSWFMGMDAMDIVGQHHRIADLQGKLVSNNVGGMECDGFSSSCELGYEDEDIIYDEFYSYNENKQTNEDCELTLQCRSILSKYLSEKLKEKEDSLKFKRNLLIKLSNMVKLLELSPLSNFPFTSSNRHMFLNPIGIGRRSIIWRAFDFINLIPCVLKLYKLDFPSLNEYNSNSNFSPNVSISSNAHKLKEVIGNSFSKLKKVRSYYNIQMNKLKSKEIPTDTLLFLNNNCNILLSDTNVIKSRQMNHGVSELIFCTGISEWQTPPSMNSAIVEVYSLLERYDIHSYLQLNGVFDEATALMYTRSIFRLFSLFYSFKDNEIEFAKSTIFPIKASRIYVRREECCFILGPLDLINLEERTGLFQDQNLDFRKSYPRNLMRCGSFIKSHRDDDLINYLPKFVREIVSFDEEFFYESNLRAISSKLAQIGNSNDLLSVIEKLHVYMIGSLLYYSLSGEYYNPDTKDFSILINISQSTRELLELILKENLCEIPTISKLLSLHALHPEELVGTVGVHSNSNIFQFQLSELKLDAS